MIAVRALAWKEVRQLLPNFVALTVLTVVAPLLAAVIAAVQGGHDTRHICALGMLAMAAMVLGATAACGDAAPAFEAMQPLARPFVALVKMGVRLAALVMLIGLGVAVLALLGKGGDSAIPQLVDASPDQWLPWLLAPLLAAALSSAFRTRPMSAVLDALWITPVAAVLVVPIIGASTPALGWTATGLLGLLAFVASQARQGDGLRLRQALLRFSVITSCILAVLVVAWLVIGNLVASRRLAQAHQVWEETLGPLDALQRYPQQPANEAARQVEEALAPMAISIVPKDSRVTPPGESLHDRDCRIAIDDFARQVLETTVPRHTVMSSVVTDCLVEHAQHLEALRLAALSGEVPKQAVTIAEGPMAPIPNLLGHMRLQRWLLTDAIAASRAGRPDIATADMEAAIRITEGLRGQPVLISQLIAIAGSRLQATALRALDGVPATLLDRIDPKAARPALMQAARIEAWTTFELADASIENIMYSLGVSPHHGFAERALNYVVVGLVRPAARMRAAAGIEAQLSELLALESATTCELAFAALEERVVRTGLAPDWLSAISLMQPSPPSSYLRRAAHLELEIELTRIILEVRAAREADAARAWPANPAGLASHVCPGRSWRYKVLPEGRMYLGCWETPPTPRGSAQLHLTYTESAR